MRPAASRLHASWTRYWFTPTAPYWLAACRLIVGLSLCAYLWHKDPWDPLSALGVLPTLPAELWHPVSFVGLLGLGPPTQAALTIIWAATLTGAVAMTLGLATRFASIIAALGGLYLIALPNCFGKINHGFNVLGMMLLVLPFARAGAALSVDSVVRRARRMAVPELSSDFNWPVKLIQFSFAFMLLFAGWNKLVVGGLDWVFSDSLRNILVFQNFVVRGGRPTAGVVYPVIQHPWLWTAVAGGVVASELGFVAIMFVRRSWQRAALLAVGFGFVVSLGVVMQLPNPVLLALLLVFVNWNWVVERANLELQRLSRRPLRTRRPYLRRLSNRPF
jgi:hypothetical protein